jgi:prevent-host-death family protein
MREISAKEARGKLSSLLKSVEIGEEVVILRRGKQVARLLPPLGIGRRLPSLKKFRASILIKGEPLGATVLRGRKEERF